MKAFILISLIPLLFNYFEIKISNADYRDNYIGSYSCKRTYKHLNHNFNGVVYNTDTITISVIKGVENSEIVLKIKEGSYQMTLYNSQLISKYSSLRIYAKFYATDSISINFIPSNGPEAFFYKGIKK